MPRLRFASADEIARWNESVEQLPGGGEVWQSREYGQVKRFQRYRPLYVVGPDFPPTLVLEKTIPVLGRLWYVPGGPTADGVASTLEAARQLGEFARINGVFLLKIEPRLHKDAATLERFRAAGFGPAVRVLPNESTILLDISGEESDVMARFSGSTRTKIRKADKLGFEVRRVEATDAHCRIMYDLLAETGEGRFELRPYAYYRNFWRTFAEAGRGQLFLGYADGVPVAGMFATVFGTTSGYKDGASTRSGSLPNGAMYRMQWELILWGREHGAEVHDLIGSPPSDRLDDPEHPLHGVGQYKLRLSKQVTDYIGVLDLPLRPRYAQIWRRLGDPIARRWALGVRKDVFY